MHRNAVLNAATAPTASIATSAMRPLVNSGHDDLWLRSSRRRRPRDPSRSRAKRNACRILVENDHPRTAGTSRGGSEKTDGTRAEHDHATRRPRSPSAPRRSKRLRARRLRTEPSRRRSHRRGACRFTSARGRAPTRPVPRRGPRSGIPRPERAPVVAVVEAPRCAQRRIDRRRSGRSRAPCRPARTRTTPEPASDDGPDELVADHASDAHPRGLSVEEMEVGAADRGHEDLDEGVVGFTISGAGTSSTRTLALTGEHDRFHGNVSRRSKVRAGTKGI